MEYLTQSSGALLPLSALFTFECMIFWALSRKGYKISSYIIYMIFLYQMEVHPLITANNCDNKT